MDLRPHRADHTLTNGRWSPPPDVRDYSAPVTGTRAEPHTEERALMHRANELANEQIERQRVEYRRYLVQSDGR